MPVDTRCPEYEKSLPVWELVRDCDEGANAIKARRNRANLYPTGIGSIAGTAYLPRLTLGTQVMTTRFGTMPIRTAPTL